MQNADKRFYEKKIVYLDYMERGEKVKNGGYLKWEAKGDNSRVEIHIRGLYPTDNLQGEIRLLSFEKSYPADKMQLHFGVGEYLSQWNNANLAQTGLALAACDGVEIRLSDTRLLKGRWQQRKKPENIKTEEKKEEEPEIIETEEKEEPEITMTKENVIKEPEIITAEEPEAEPVMEKRVQKEPVLVSDKWEQLNCYYPKIHPFGDKREYLSITPRDFVVLSGKYHNLVHNSFLLHGYYNYGHVVLARLREGQEDVYYLGVPGVYFDREKQAALLFGFEGFEADSDCITDGGFGYYMKKVEI